MMLLSVPLVLAPLQEEVPPQKRRVASPTVLACAIPPPWRGQQLLVDVSASSLSLFLLVCDPCSLHKRCGGPALPARGALAQARRIVPVRAAPRARVRQPGPGRVGNAAAQQYRFTAAELVPPHARPVAISAVLSGGVVGAVVGPEYAKRTRLLLPRVPYAGVFVITAGVCVLNALFVTAVRFPPHVAMSAAWPAPGALLAPPARTAAVAVASVCWFVMTFLMTPVPLSMLSEGFTFDDASLVVQMHMLAMYVPSFFTGRVVTSIGPVRTMLLGTLVVGAASAVFGGGGRLAHYIAGELLVGGGWNLQFVGATAQLAATEGGAPVTAANDLCVFVAAGVGSLSGAAALKALGWRTGHQAVAGAASAGVALIVTLQALVERHRKRTLRVVSEPAV